MMGLHTQVGQFLQDPLLLGEYLIAGGGGGGGGVSSKSGGTGGAGGLLQGSFSAFPGSSWTVTVGAAGAGSTGSAAGVNGGNSSFYGQTAIGGGRGGSAGGSEAGGDGGSGGGGGWSNGGAGHGTAGQGVDGTAGTAGGGGDGGGVSVTSSINGTSRVYCRSGSLAGPPRANSGDGGGIQVTGAAGVVIIRYPGPARATGGTITNDNGFTVHTFTSSGTLAVGA